MNRAEIRRRTVLIGGSATAASLVAPVVAAASTPAANSRVNTHWVGGLGFDGNGQVVALRTAGRDQTLDAPGGLYISDPVSGARHPAVGRVRPSAGGIVVNAEISELSAAVDVEYRSTNRGTVDVSGAIRDATGEDRVLDSVFALPLPVTSGAWGRDIARMESFDLNGSPGSQLSMPVASVANAESSFALAYAIPPERPSRFEMTVSPPVEFEQAIAWEFENDGDAEGWFPVGAEPQITPLEVAGGIASATSTGTRPIMQQAEPFSVDAQTGVVIEITQQVTAASVGFVNWATADAPAFDGSRRANFAVTASDHMRTYHVELPPEPSPVTRLRLAPMGAPGDIKIDSIRVLRRVPIGPPEFALRQMWGFSAAASGTLQSRAPFAFTVDLGVSPVWGYRSALQRYYDRSPEWFANPAGESAKRGNTAYGCWQFIPSSSYENTDAYGFQMAGRGKWDPETGEDATTLEQYATNDEWEASEANGVRIFPYTIPGQREVTGLAELPQAYDDAIAQLQSWTHDPITFSANNETNAFESVDSHRKLIASSSLADADGKMTIRVRNTNWGGNSVTFPTNSNPRLFLGNPKIRTMGRYLLDEYVPLMLSDSRVDGIFSDTLYEWGRYYDYRKDHFPAARIPLTYADETVFPTAIGSPVTSPYGTAHKPGLYNNFSNLEYLWELRELLHAQGKMLMTNGLRALNDETRAFDGFASDVIGVEMTMNFLTTDDTDAAFYRVVGHHKPVLPMMYNNNVAANGTVVTDWSDRDLVERTWKHALLYGLAPASSNTTNIDVVVEPGALDESRIGTQGLEVEFQERYLPMLRALLTAGWQPVTGVQTDASANAAGVRVERYGRPDDFYLVVYHLGSATPLVAFDVDREVVPGIDAERVTDVVTGQPPGEALASALRGHEPVAMQSQAFHVLHFDGAH